MLSVDLMRTSTAIKSLFFALSVGATNATCWAWSVPINKKIEHPKDNHRGNVPTDLGFVNKFINAWFLR